MTEVSTALAPSLDRNVLPIDCVRNNEPHSSKSRERRIYPWDKIVTNNVEVIRHWNAQGNEREVWTWSLWAYSTLPSWIICSTFVCTWIGDLPFDFPC